MYLYTSQELQIMHEERVGKLTKERHINHSRGKGTNQPLKQLVKLFKRDEA